MSSQKIYIFIIKNQMIVSFLFIPKIMNIFIFFTYFIKFNNYLSNSNFTLIYIIKK